MDFSCILPYSSIALWVQIDVMFTRALQLDYSLYVWRVSGIIYFVRRRGLQQPYDQQRYQDLMGSYSGQQHPYFPF